MKSQVSDLVTTAERRYKTFKQDSSGSVQQLLTQVEEQIQESVELIAQTYDNIQTNLDRTFKQNPARVIASAFTAGVLVGITLARVTQLKPKK